MEHFILGMITGVIAGIFLGAGIANDIWSTEAIDRGYAWYCPDDGRLTWKNECEETVIPKD